MSLLTNQAGTLLGPLTTTWTMPETCSIYLQGFRGQSCNSMSGGGRVQDNTACWPPVKPGIASPAWPFSGWGFYSPGVACPAGYTTACTAVYGQRAQWDIQFALVSSETAVGCCPTGFVCGNSNGNTCILTASDTAVPTASCDYAALTDSGTKTFPHFITVTQTDTADGDVGIQISPETVVLRAPMFQINFQASDLPASTTTASTTLSTATTRTTSSTIQQTSTADNSLGKGSSGLSNGAKVGLGVSIGLGAAFLLAFAGFIYYYRRARRSQIPIGSELANNEISEAADTPKVKTLPGQVYEMEDYQAPAELPTRW
ncbi:hypothetical protein J3F84DRAFT_299931 [Trichoderma pleuroticola]